MIEYFSGCDVDFTYPNIIKEGNLSSNDWRQTAPRL